jgi:hypothetical protein
VNCVDAAAVAAQLDEVGHARCRGLLSPAACAALIALYDVDARFRSRVVMARHGYGRGEYRYFDYPLPETVAALRAGLYGALAGVANAWAERLGSGARYPVSITEYTAICHAAGQRRPTPLLLKYGPGDYNHLHQDLYGEHVFPLQVTVLLSPAAAFTGGEFVLTEQRVRQQGRVEVVALEQGDAVVFPVRERPVPGRLGWTRARVRHGVSRLHSGERFTLGVIFHDAV